MGHRIRLSALSLFHYNKNVKTALSRVNRFVDYYRQAEAAITSHNKPNSTNLIFYHYIDGNAPV